ncbi:HAD family hydrolase [Maridesulfovibrio zosterae]|uniref:HAD family hydrolase n=1 Tax=Maridesulfovibrio zosterae TaxID=82171 RepID=UPI0003FF277B|nr:HAD family hydrolase [Maridesulfovibrio zosterae]
MEAVYLSDITPPNVLKNIKGIIFDCDGVLINSFEANKWYYNWFKSNYDLEPMTADEEKFVHAHTNEEALKHILPADVHDEALSIRENPDLIKAADLIEVENGLTRVLEWLRTNKIRAAINTNRGDSLPAILQRFGIENFFSPAVTYGMLPNSKPHPEGVHYILSKWSMKPEEVVYIGDTWVDESCAEQAGVEFWAYRNPNLNARLHINDYWVLSNLLEKAKNDVWADCSCS